MVSIPSFLPSFLPHHTQVAHVTIEMWGKVYWWLVTFRPDHCSPHWRPGLTTAPPTDVQAWPLFHPPPPQHQGVEMNCFFKWIVEATASRIVLFSCFKAKDKPRLRKNFSTSLNTYEDKLMTEDGIPQILQTLSLHNFFSLPSKRVLFFQEHLSWVLVCSLL